MPQESGRSGTGCRYTCCRAAKQRTWRSSAHAINQPAGVAPGRCHLQGQNELQVAQQARIAVASLSVAQSCSPLVHIAAAAKVNNLKAWGEGSEKREAVGATSAVPTLTVVLPRSRSRIFSGLRSQCTMFSLHTTWSVQCRFAHSIKRTQPGTHLNRKRRVATTCCATRRIITRLLPWKLQALMYSYKLMDSNSKVMHRWPLRCGHAWVGEAAGREHHAIGP